MKVKKKKIISIVLMMFLPLMIFSNILNVMSYRRMTAETYVHASNLNTIGGIRKINYAISFGKRLDKFYGLENLLRNVEELSDSILAVEILDKEGKQIQVVGEYAEHRMPKSQEEEYIIEKDGIYSFIDFDAGQIVLRLDSKPLTDATIDFIRKGLQVDGILLVCVMLILVILCLFTKKDTISVQHLKKISLLLLICSQLGFGLYSTLFTVDAYKSSIETIAQSAVKVVKMDIREVMDKGAKYEELTQIDTYLEHICEDIPEITSMSIREGNTTEGNGNEGSEKEFLEQLQIDYEKNQNLINRKIVNNMIDVAILIMVTIFISLEIIGFRTEHMNQKERRKEGQFYFPGFRMFVFVSGIAFSLDCGFISILSNRLYGQMELSDNFSFLSGMPNTMYSLAVVLGLFGCSFLINKLGIKKTLILGISMGIAGYLLCAVSVGLPLLIAARFVFGFCDGLVINAIRLFASGQKDTETHNKILVTYLAAINLGVCCSVVLGGLVADVTSYTIVFILGALLGVLSLFFVKLSGFSNEKRESKMSFMGAIKELKIGKVFVFMVFVVIPIYIATLYVGYTFPLYGDEIGYSNSLVSGCLMINYLIIAYLTDPISDWVSKNVKPRIATVVYVLLQSLSIGLFAFFSSTWTAILALVLTSLWDCFGMVVIDSVLDDVENTTTEKNTLLQMMFGKIGMVIGPMLVTARLSHGAAVATQTIVYILLGGILVYLAYSLLVGKKKAK